MTSDQLNGAVLGGSVEIPWALKSGLVGDSTISCVPAPTRCMGRMAFGYLNKIVGAIVSRNNPVRAKLYSTIVDGFRQL